MFSSNSTGLTGANYIEDVFSTWLYTGNGSTQTITNGIDLAGKGGLVWIKSRQFAYNHSLTDTARGVNQGLASNTTSAQVDYSGSGGSVTAFNSTGFSLGSRTEVNDTGTNVSWTFRKQPKFFDVVTYTGTGSNTTIAHNLGSVPGCIIVKRTDTTAAWAVYHRSLANTQYLVLNTTAAAATGATWWNSTTPTSSVFSVGTDASVNASGGTYVAYVFAHDAGGFGLTGTDNVISCGSYTGNGSATGPSITLGYEPQWLMIAKRVDSTSDWPIFDNMRGISVTGNTQRLDANGTQDEATISAVYAGVSATGFYLRTSNANFNASGGTYIYIAIRRGPMKVPTTGTSVFTPATRSGTSSATTLTSAGFPVDAQLIGRRNISGLATSYDRLRGATLSLTTSNANAEASVTNGLIGFDYMSGSRIGSHSSVNETGYNYVDWFLRRAPGFFDEVCYTGTGAATTVAHNLGVAPELMIVKRRSAIDNWQVYAQSLGASQRLQLQSSNAASAASSTIWNSTTPTSSVFSVGTDTAVNASGSTYVNYLFASCPGVSKVGSYTGTGTTQTINCGFTGGARFVLIKRADSTGDWYVWDSARGIVSGNDPYLLLNSTAAEVTSTDYIDTASAGFEISSTAPAAINASSGTFIFLAIA